MDLLGQLAADPVNLGDVLDTSPSKALQATKMAQEPLAALGADAADLFETGLGASLAAPLPVTRDREAMGLVTDLLDEMHAG